MNAKEELSTASILHSPSLIDICHLVNSNDVAVEHYDEEKVIKINFKEVNDVRDNVSFLLQTIDKSNFIGICPSIEGFCIPSLILGILSCGRGFINLPEVGYMTLCEQLEIQYLFSSILLPETEIEAKQELHGVEVFLLRLNKRIFKTAKNENDIRYAYAVTTSGSSGVPKLVKVLHASIVPNILDLKKHLKISKMDKIAQLTILTFDPSIIEIFLSLSSGATLATVSQNLKNDSSRLLDVIFKNNVTILQCTPSVLLSRWSLNDLKKTILGKESHLRVLLLGGEPFPKLEILTNAKDNCNETKLFNIYGITEVSCWSSINEIELETNGDKVNVSYLGKPLTETIYEVRTASGEAVNKGQGHLYIGSNSRICVLENEEVENLQRPVFRLSGDLVTINEQGDIFYNGRIDRVVKRYGHKVDLNALEKTAEELNFVQRCVAYWNEDAHALILCVSLMSDLPKQSTSNCINDISVHVRKLPTQSWPDKIKIVNELQLTTNGKVCKESIVKLIQDSKTKQGGKAEAEIIDIKGIFKNLWLDLLSSRNGGFVTLGGTSVIALQMARNFSSETGTEFPELIGMLLKDKTLDECYEYVKNVVVLSGPSLTQQESMIQKRNFEDFQEGEFSNVTHQSIKDKKIKHESKQYLSANSSNVTNIQANYSVSDERTNDSSQKMEHSQVLLNACEWQKRKGRTYGSINKSSSKYDLTKQKFCIEVKRRHNLFKCVDASPTIFHNFSGDTFVTVGSHSGIILTTRLGPEKESKSDLFEPIEYKVTLPDRIEASILVLDDFKGVVGCYDGYVYCVHLKLSHIIWKFKTGEMVKCTAIACKERKRIFVGSYDKYMYCLCAQTGENLWRVNVGKGSIYSTPHLHDGSDLILFGTLDGTCAAVKKNTGKIIWLKNLGNPIFSSPAVLPDKCVLFCTVSGELTCFDVEIGHKMWSLKVNGTVFVDVVVHTDPIKRLSNIILATKGNSFYRWEVNESIKSPLLKYEVHLNSPIFATPYCDDSKGIIVVAGTDGLLYILNYSNGEILKTFRLDGDVFSSPAVHADELILGCRDDNLYILTLKSQN
ncbi:acyl-CoA synthetase family member 4 homolog isoform X2 [Orussus abietinus]|nr:acyl-CoA synthetase family member 4 homolog isoform X2 [Orussus abietinus]